jgi:hypothetical protein
VPVLAQTGGLLSASTRFPLSSIAVVRGPARGAVPNGPFVDGSADLARNRIVLDDVKRDHSAAFVGYHALTLLHASSIPGG